MVGQFLKEDNGNFSSMRLAFLIAVVCIMVSWSVVSITKGELIGFDWQEVGLFLGLFGLKGVQKFAEGKGSKGGSDEG